jgi:hypothetical protein
MRTRDPIWSAAWTAIGLPQETTAEFLAVAFLQALALAAFLIEGGRVTAGVRHVRFSRGLMEMQTLPAAVHASGEETCDMVAPAMKKREFNFTEATRF